ncbi:MAG TPA: HEAT repeat domain-containing protein [Planctomycetota bacterium]
MKRATPYRGYAAVALGLLDPREYRDSIGSLVKESRRLPVLLQQASIGLGLMSDPQAVALLLSVMQGERGSIPPLSVLAATATAVGFLGDQSSVEPLVQMLADDSSYTPLARAFAAVALGMVADKGALPWNSAIAGDLNYRAVVGTLTDPRSGSGLLDIR